MVRRRRGDSADTRLEWPDRAVSDPPGRCQLIGLVVHDDFHRRGVSAALLGALLYTSDNWLDLKRLELTVFVDNEPAIRLYRKFGFEIEDTRRAAALSACSSRARS